MKKAIAILLVYSILMTLLVVSPFTASADEKNIDETSDTVASGTTGDCTWELEDGVLTISGNGNMADYIYDDLTAPWRYYDYNTVVIKNGVTSIGHDAFYNCAGLTNIDIPDSVTSIGNSAFYNTAWYNNQPDGLVYAGKVAYKMKGTCPSEVVIKDGTVSITAYAFSNCKELTNVTIPDSVTSIGSWAFYRCLSLTSVTIPDSVASIGGAAFYGCTGIKSVTLNQTGVDSFRDSFVNCNNLGTVILKDSVASIGNSAFYGCTALTKITIPDSAKAIASNAFYGCSSLTSVTIPKSVTDIYDKAFGYYNQAGLGEAKVKGFTIYGYEDSEAERYANNNNFKFIALDDEPSDPTKTTDREIFGDIDGDGAITIVDTTFLQRYTIQAETPYPIGEKMK
ncbi:MAG: leucine-rich repeat protein [Ruminococcus sp.]|nr:leucine-rich repeat protein [Ruminococcus sp.]